MNRSNRILFSLHIFVGLGALVGGTGAILEPNNPLGISSEVLQGSPFTSFLIPGIILFTVIGLGNLSAALLLKKDATLKGYLSSIVSWGLVIWIMVQCIILNTVEIIHGFYFFIGIIQAFLSLKILYEKDQFPINIVKKVFN
jgi:hypothetical protein